MARTTGMSSYSSFRPTAYVSSRSTKVDNNRSDRASSARFRPRAVECRSRPAALPTHQSAATTRCGSATGHAVKILQRQAQRIHHRMATRAHRVLRCCAIRSRIDRTRLRHRSLQKSPTFGGGGGGGIPSTFSRIHLPRSTGEVRSGYDVTVRMLPCPSNPHRGLSCPRVAPEVAALDVGNAVVPREPLVDERVVGAQQVEHVAVLAHDAVEEQLGFPAKRLPQVVVEIGKALRRARTHVAEIQPLPREIRDERGARIGHHPPDLPREHGRSRAAASPPPAVPCRECCSRGRTTSWTPAPNRSRGRRC